MAREFTAGEYLDATKMLASITELILLDRYWTAEVKAASEGDSSALVSDPLEGLGAVVVQLERLLVEVELRARSIAAAATRQGSTFEGNFVTLTSEDGPFTERQRGKVIELVNSRSQGDVLAFVEAATADASAQLEPERKLLNAELEKAKKGGRSDGDLSAEQERALAEVAVMASVVFGPEAGVIVEAVGHLLDFLFG